MNYGAWAEVSSGYFNDDTYADFHVGFNEVYYGNGNGGFPISIEIGVNSCDNSTASAVADFNVDGFDDLILGVGCDSAKIFLSTGGTDFNQSASIVVDTYAAGITTANTLADFNRDGFCDFALTDPGDYYSRVYLGYGDGQGGLISLDTLHFYGRTSSITAVDINRDQYLDIVTVNDRDKAVEIFLGNQLGEFIGPVIVDVDGSFSGHSVLSSGDYDRDGNPDLAVGSMYGEYDVLILLNDLPDAPVIPDEMVTTGYDNVSLDIYNPDLFQISRNYTSVAGSDYRRLDIDNNSSLDEISLDYNVQNGEYRLVITPSPNLPPDPLFSIGIRIDGTANAVVFYDYAVPGTITSRNGTASSDSIVFYYKVEPISSIEPANGIPNDINPPQFDWSGTLDGITADSFHFQLDRYYDFSSPVLIWDTSGLVTPDYSPATQLGIDSVYYWRYRYFSSGMWSGFSRTFAVYMVASSSCGEVNADGIINLLDIIYYIDWKFKEGPEPVDMASADVNSDGAHNLLDILYLIDYKFKGGPAPDCP